MRIMRLKMDFQRVIRFREREREIVNWSIRNIMHILSMHILLFTMRYFEKKALRIFRWIKRLRIVHRKAAIESL